MAFRWRADGGPKLCAGWIDLLLSASCVHQTPTIHVVGLISYFIVVLERNNSDTKS